MQTQLNGIRRHILVDTLGLIIEEVLSAINITDGKVGCTLISRPSGEFVRLKKVLVDGIYAGTLSKFAPLKFGV